MTGRESQLALSTLSLLLSATGCLATKRSIGDQPDADGSGGESGTGGDTQPFIPDGDGGGGGDGGDDGASGGDPGDAEPLIGAALKADGLCGAYQYEEDGLAPELTLQFSGGSLVCNEILWNALWEAGDAPTWFGELFLPFDEPGTYELDQYPAAHGRVSVIDADGGGGGAGGALEVGVLVLETVGPDMVTGHISGLRPFAINDIEQDVNGPFEAVRCTEEDWLDYPYDPEDPPDITPDPACRHP